MNEIYYTANDSKFIASEFGDEMILMNLESGDYINLNSVSADIWKQADKNKISTEQIISYLLEEYEIDKEICSNETLACIDEMVSKNLLIQVR